MAKLTTIVALISALLIIIANASYAYRTIVTTVDIDEFILEKGKRSSSKECRQEAKKRNLTFCRRYVSQSDSGDEQQEQLQRRYISQSGSADEQQEQLQRRYISQSGSADEQQVQLEIQKCCLQLDAVKNQCQCQVVDLLTNEQMIKEQITREEILKAMERVKNILHSCGLLEKCLTGKDPIQESCQQQIQSQQNLRQCKEYIRQQVSEQGSRRDNDGYGQKLGECCDHLKQMQTECRCQGLSQAIEQQQSQGQLQGQAAFEAFRIAKDLPSACGVSPSKCQFRSQLRY